MGYARLLAGILPLVASKSQYPANIPLHLCVGFLLGNCRAKAHLPVCVIALMNHPRALCLRKQFHPEQRLSQSLPNLPQRCLDRLLSQLLPTQKVWRNFFHKLLLFFLVFK